MIVGWTPTPGDKEWPKKGDKVRLGGSSAYVVVAVHGEWAWIDTENGKGGQLRHIRELLPVPSPQPTIRDRASELLRTSGLFYDDRGIEPVLDVLAEAGLLREDEHTDCVPREEFEKAHAAAKRMFRWVVEKVTLGKDELLAMEEAERVLNETALRDDRAAGLEDAT